jgi:hypothetical protein
MRPSTVCAIAILIAASVSLAATAAEPIAIGVPAAPAKPSVTAIDARAFAVHQYFYVDFPRHVQALANEKELAEAELALIARRVDSYRPFRSFGRYAATYFADQSWQIEMLAAQQRLECIRTAQADLWRQKQAIAALYLSQPSR